MSTKAIRELLSDYLSACARANDYSGRAREPDEIEREMYRSALAEVEAIEKAAKFITNVDTSEPLTAELATRAVEASDVFERIAKESK